MTMRIAGRCTLWLAAGSIALVVCAAAESPAKETGRVADALDRFVQARFEQLDGRFGMSRLQTMPGHAAANLFPESEAEKKQLVDVNAMGHAYQIAFLHIPHPAGTYSNKSDSLPRARARASGPALYRLPMRGEQSVGNLRRGQPQDDAVLTAQQLQERQKQLLEEYHKQEEAFKDAAVAELPALKQGKSRTRTVEGWNVFLRPVRATKTACVNCHSGAKQGETLGVMVYAVSETRSPSTEAAAGRSGRQAKR